MRTIRNSLGSLAIIGGIIASLNFVHAQTWLELTGVSNGQAYLNLYNATNQVYAIWSTTNLLANWNVETEMWPEVDQEPTPFTVPMLERQNLFVRAEDWTGVDSNGDGIPDWWIWMYFGNLDETATNLDSQGNTLLNDYTNGLDPIVIQFTLSTASQYINTLTVPVQINLFAGVPGYYAVLVNDINQADANWHAYTGTNITVTLSSTDGVYTVSVGLRGLPPNATATWQTMQLTLNTVAPTVVITNPTAGVVSQPMIQVQGFASESLSHVTFDVSNATGIFTNQTGYITSRYYDLNRLDFTTNWFQCYDIALNNGLNTVTLHVTDLAGNVTTTNFNFTLDYSGDTTPPALTVIWPQDGTAIGGSSFTLQAQVDDDTASVTAQIVDANGDTNMVQGLVERSGLVWAQNLPLAAGTSTVMVTATDAAGNTSVTNLTLVQSTVTVTMNPLSSDQQNQWLVTVTGTVSDPSCAVTVNSVQAKVKSDGTWEADNVRASPTGVASFDVEVYAGSTSGMAASRKSNSLVHANDAGADNSLASQMLNQLRPATVVASDYSGIGHYEWTTDANDMGMSNAVQDETLTWDYLSGGTWIYSDGWGACSGPPDVPSFKDGINSWLFTPTFEYAALNNTNYQRIVQTKVMIAPQGIVSLVKTQKMQTMQTMQSYLVRACAASFSHRILPGSWDDFLHHDYFFNFITGGIWDQQWYAGDVPLPPEWLQINEQTLINSGVTNVDGSVWGVTVVSARSGATMDVTPTLIPTVTLKNNDYTFLVKASELYPPAVDANRDGNITFDAADQTTADKPYQFWVNNDYDWYDNTIGDYADLDPSTRNDANNTTISCTRDLEDYTRLWINTQGLTTELQNGTFLLALEWTNVTGAPGIRLFQAVETNGGSLYLTDEATALAQSNAPYGNCLNGGGVDEIQGTTPFFIPTSFWSAVSTNQPVAHLLFDAVSRGSGQLVISIYKNDGLTKLAEGPGVWLDLKDVKEMYERWTVDSGGSPATTASLMTKPYSYDWTIPAENNYILFVHGWNLAPWERDAYAETAFKRLYWQGYKGRFGAFQWPTLTGGTTFDQSELLAWQSAEGLKKKLDDLNGTYPNHVYLMAHSMGNVVAGEALKLKGPNQPVNTYIAMQAAIASHVYDPDTPTRSLGPAGIYDDHTPNCYANYWTNGAPGYFDGINGAGTFVNFYNPNDYALVTATFSWEFDQDSKPDTIRGYAYDSVADEFYHNATELVFPFDRYEIFSACDEARCHALGSQADVGGKFAGNQLNLQSTFGFGEQHKDHSGEFNSDNMSRAPFWNRTLIKMNLKEE